MASGFAVLLNARASVASRIAVPTCITGLGITSTTLTMERSGREMKRIYELAAGDTFWHGGLFWRVDEFVSGNHRGCRPTSDPRCGSYVRFHIDTEVQVFEF
jgi:hypothetical protein